MTDRISESDDNRPADHDEKRGLVGPTARWHEKYRARKLAREREDAIAELDDATRDDIGLPPRMRPDQVDLCLQNPRMLALAFTLKFNR